MAKKSTKSSPAVPPECYWGADVPMRAIRRFARQVAERFQPDKIILFGSYAYGTPNADSDVDILVIMPARNQRSKAGRIRWEVPAPFPMDLIVRTPENLRWRLEERGLVHDGLAPRRAPRQRHRLPLVLNRHESF
jgi:predicted nucleotidyltransferase